MNLKNIHAIFYIPEISRYKDRVSLWHTLAGKIGSMTLIVSKTLTPQQVAQYPDMEIIYPDKPLQGFYTRLKWVKNILSNQLQVQTCHVVVETFGHFLLCNRLKRKFPGIRWLTNLYLLPKWDFTHVIWPMYKHSMFLDKSLYFSFLRMYLERQSLKLADAVILQSEFLKERIEESYPDYHKEILTVYNSFSQDHSAPIPVFEDSDKWHFLVVGSISRLKGVDILFQFLRYLDLIHVDYKCTFIGRILEYDKSFVHSELAAFHPDRIEIIPEIPFDQLNVHYRKSDYLLHFSRIEGSPRVLGEALSYGLPCIAFDHPGIRIFENIKNGLVKADPNMETTWNRILAHQLKCGHTERALIRNEMKINFSPEVVVNMWENILLEQVTLNK